MNNAQHVTHMHIPKADPYILVVGYTLQCPISYRRAACSVPTAPPLYKIMVGLATDL